MVSVSILNIRQPCLSSARYVEDCRGRAAINQSDRLTCHFMPNFGFRLVNDEGLQRRKGAAAAPKLPKKEDDSIGSLRKFRKIRFKVTQPFIGIVIVLKLFSRGKNHLCKLTSQCSHALTNKQFDPLLRTDPVSSFV